MNERSLRLGRATRCLLCFPVSPGSTPTCRLWGCTRCISAPGRDQIDGMRGDLDALALEHLADVLRCDPGPQQRLGHRLHELVAHLSVGKWTRSIEPVEVASLGGWDTASLRPARRTPLEAHRSLGVPLDHGSALGECAAFVASLRRRIKPAARICKHCRQFVEQRRDSTPLPRPASRPALPPILGDVRVLDGMKCRHRRPPSVQSVVSVSRHMRINIPATLPTPCNTSHTSAGLGYSVQWSPAYPQCLLNLLTENAPHVEKASSSAPSHARSARFV